MRTRIGLVLLAAALGWATAASGRKKVVGVSSDIVWRKIVK